MSLLEKINFLMKFFAQSSQIKFDTTLDPGSEIRDPGWEKFSIRIRDEQPGSYFFIA
jgi:hypothetical protein